MHKRLKPIVVFFSGLILLQSCVVYYKTPATVEQAAQEQIRTRVKTKFGETIKYSYINAEDGNYFGTSKKYDDLVKTQIYPADIESLHLQNKKASTLLTVIGIASPLILVLGVVVYMECCFSLN